MNTFIAYGFQGAGVWLLGLLLLTFQVAASTPVKIRFEWVPQTVETNKNAYFYWDIRNVKECYSVNASTGKAELKAISGTAGPVTNSFPYVGKSRWYCIDLNGKRYPADAASYLEALRIVEAPLAAPLLTRKTGTYNTGLQVGVESGSQAIYRYTLNGSSVTESSPLLNGLLTINSTSTLKVRPYRTGFNPGPEATATYTIVATPAIERFEWVPKIVETNKNAYFYWNIRHVKECYSVSAGSGTSERKAIEGSAGPATNAFPYTGISKWYCFDLNGDRYPRDQTKFIEALRKVEAPLSGPVLLPAAGQYQQSVNVAVSPVADVVYRYTLNGATVTEQSSIMSAQLSFTSSTTLKVRGFRTGFNPSPETTAYYDITNGAAAAPTFTPGPGTYAAPLVVNLATTTASATIRYTTDGSDVTQAASIYTAPLVLSTTSTIKTKSFKAGMADSEQRVALFTLKPQVTYLHTDVLGSVIAESDSAGQVKKTTEYKPFGESKDNE